MVMFSSSSMPFKPIYRLMMSVAVLVLILYVCRRIYYTSRQTISIDSIPSGHAVNAIGVSPAAPTLDITFYDKHSVHVYLPIWPVPNDVLVQHDKERPMRLSSTPEFIFKTATSSKIVKEAIKRYKYFIFRGDAADHECSSQAIKISTFTIVVRNESEALNIDTNYDYELIISTKTKDATIVANSPFGIMYALETLSQLFFNQSCIPYKYVHIKDQPSYRHRGLLLDVGRRIAPKPLVLNILDSLSYLKMNVLHFHLSDFCRFSIQSEKFPQLTAGLKQGQFYTKEDIKDIIEHARQRGIRVIPEIELPGHAKGLKALSGEHLEFCDDSYRQIYNDPEGKSMRTLKQLLAELADLFPDRYLHMGSDETSTGGKCTLEGTKSLETEVAKYILSLGRIPVAWEEALLNSGVEVPGMVFQSWISFDAVSKIIKKNYNTIESHHRYFYMDVVPHHDTKVPWVDIAPADMDLNSKRLLGGELAMWSDHYCETRQCWDEVNWQKRGNAPVAYWMYKPEYDKEFSESMMGMIWPNGIPAAGSFWNFDKALPRAMYQSLVKHVHQVMISRGIKACPIGCSCDEVQRCGVKYRGYHAL